MATVGTTHDTLLGWAKLQNPKGRIAKIVELLTQQNEVLEDMLWIQANNTTGHKTTVRTGLPAVYWAAINEGVPASTSAEAEITEGIGRLKTWHEVDSDLVDMSDTPNDFRLTRAYAHMEAINQELCSTLWYGNATIDTKEFNGLSMRYSSLSATNASNIINAGGVDATDNASIWLIVWHGATMAGIFPRGSTAGVKHKDYGRMVSENGGGTAGNLLEVFRDRWSVEPGLAVMDWRQGVRICNIDVSQLRADTGAQLADLRKNMLRAVHRVFSLKMGTPVFYMNRTVLEALDVQALDNVRTAGVINSQTVDGIVKRTFGNTGIPVKVSDALLNTEAVVS